MKRIAIIIAILLFAAPSYSMSRPHKPNNLDILGSNDRKQRHEYVAPPSIPPNTPVPTPEPSTLLLVGGGLVALAAWRRR